MSGVFHLLLHAFNIVILVYFFLINIFYLLFIILSLVGLFRHRDLTRFVSFKEVFRLPLVKPISVIAPAHNEEKTIVESVRALLSLEYPVFEVIVVTDGPPHRTPA